MEFSNRSAPKTGAGGGWGAVVNPINWRELDLAIYGCLYIYSCLYIYIGIGFEVVDGGAGAARCIGK